MNLTHKLANLLIPVLLCCACLLATGHAKPQEPAISLQRATLSISNLESSLAFYRDILGFSVRGVTPYETPALRRIFHLEENSGSQLVLLDAGDIQPRALAMVHAPGLEIDREANRQYAPALVFNTNRMDRIHEDMSSNGIEVLLPPTHLRGFSGEIIGREAAYVDPDGVRVVLFELIRTEQKSD